MNKSAEILRKLAETLRKVRKPPAESAETLRKPPAETAETPISAKKMEVSSNLSAPPFCGGGTLGGQLGVVILNIVINELQTLSG